MRTTVAILVVCCLTLCSGSAGAQTPVTLHLEGSALFNCLVGLPYDYDADSGRSYPLVVGLHGYGSNAESFFAAGKLFAEEGIIYAVPQAPYTFLGSSGLGYSWTLRNTNDREVSDRSSALTIDYVVKVVENLKAQYQVGDVYLFGFSQGGAFTYMTALENPDLFAGVIVFGSRFNPEWFTEETLTAASGLPVFIGHGEQDAGISIQAAQEGKRILEAFDYDVTYHAFDGGHMIPLDALKVAVGWIQDRQ
jgi:phospholipase/carboxylesterase